MTSEATRDIVLTVIGPDRAGLVSDLSAAFSRYGGNWLQSSMARLAGQFAGILVVQVPESRAEEFSQAISDGLSGDLRVQVAPGSDEALEERREFSLQLTGHDQPGIVLRVSELLAKFRVNVERLETDLSPGSMSGTPTFRAVAQLTAPEDLDFGALKSALEAIENDLMVDIDLDQ